MNKITFSITESPYAKEVAKIFAEYARDPLRILTVNSITRKPIDMKNTEKNNKEKVKCVCGRSIEISKAELIEDEWTCPTCVGAMRNEVMAKPDAKTFSGGYDAEGVIWHQHSNKLLIEILKHFHKDIPVMDMGCGHNFYVSVMRYLGYDAWGTDLVNLGSRYFIPGDLTIPRPEYSVNIQKMNVLSLEVGEHIPAAKAHVYLDNLVTFGGGDIIMSWALPGQAGHGHINCQTNEWVEKEMEKRGYKLDAHRSAALRLAVMHCHCNWFQNTLMYFVPCE